MSQWTIQLMNWDKIWKELQEELGRDPTTAEVIERMLDKFFNEQQS